MSDETPRNPETPDTPDTHASGNRWEPTGEQPAHTEPASTMPVVVERRSWRERVRPAVAGAIAGTAIVTGVGGFAVGRATSEPSPAGVDREQQVGFFPGDRDGDRDGDGDGGFPGGGPGGGQDGGFPDPDGDQQAEPGSNT